MAELTSTRTGRRRRLPSLFEASPLAAWMRDFLARAWQETEERATASVRNGVLTVRVPKSEKRAAKTIEIS